MSNIDKHAVQTVADLKAGYTLGHADVAILNELARIALASLEAEPAIHRWRRVTFEPYGPYPWHYGNFIGFSKPVDGIEDEYYYAAPPAPVSVPEMKPVDLDEGFDEWYSEGESGADSVAPEWFSEAMKPVFLGTWRACRAAMLQGADGNSPAHSGCRPAQNCISPAQDGESPVIPDGWVSCSERMPEEGDDMIVFTDDIVMSGVSYSKKKGFYLQALEYDDDEPVDNVTHWMPLPAAPQQEDK